MQEINKVAEGRPHIVDELVNDQVCLVINTTEGRQSIKDSASIRQTALRKKNSVHNNYVRSRCFG